MSVAVFGARVGLVGARAARGAAVRVVCAGDVDLAGEGVRLDVLAAIHLGGSGQVGGEARVHQHLVDRHSRDLGCPVNDERQPGPGAVEGFVAREHPEPGISEAGELPANCAT